MRNLLLSSSLFLGLMSFSTAHAERIVCEPVEVGLVKSVTIDRSEKEDTMLIQYIDSSVALGAAEYGDDVDGTYYISEKLSAQLDIYIAENELHKNYGTFTREFPNSTREVIAVLCNLNSPF
jgi:hypothetical protein